MALVEKFTKAPKGAKKKLNALIETVNVHDGQMGNDSMQRKNFDELQRRKNQTWRGRITGVINSDDIFKGKFYIGNQFAVTTVEHDILCQKAEIPNVIVDSQFLAVKKWIGDVDHVFFCIGIYSTKQISSASSKQVKSDLSKKEESKSAASRSEQSKSDWSESAPSRTDQSKTDESNTDESKTDESQSDSSKSTESESEESKSDSSKSEQSDSDKSSDSEQSKTDESNASSNSSKSQESQSSQSESDSSRSEQSKTDESNASSDSSKSAASSDSASSITESSKSKSSSEDSSSSSSRAEESSQSDSTQASLSSDSSWWSDVSGIISFTMFGGNPPCVCGGAMCPSTTGIFGGTYECIGAIEDPENVCTCTYYPI